MNTYLQRQRWNRFALEPSGESVLLELRERLGEELAIAVHCSCTWRPWIPFLEGELLLEGFQPHIEVFEAEAMGHDLVQGESCWDIDIAVLDDVRLLQRLTDPDRPFGPPEIDAIADRFIRRVEKLRPRCRALLALLPPRPPAPTRGLPSFDERARALEQRLAGRLRELDGVHTVPGDLAERELGTSQALDALGWATARRRYTNAGFFSLARQLAPRVMEASGRGIEAVIVDLDNALWGGFLGEDGLPGIELGESYPGNCHRELQNVLLRWHEAGVSLALVSRNDRAEVLHAINGHPAMVLRGGDFDHLEICWEPKSVAVGRALRALGASPSGTLYIDDDPRERRIASDTFSDLRIADLPDDPAEFCAALSRLPWPIAPGAQPLPVVAPAEKAHESRQGKPARRHATRSREQFLGDLGIELEICWNDRRAIDEIVQLAASARQFDLNPVRYTTADFQALFDDPARVIITAHYRDRYGDGGLVGCAVILHTDAGTEITTFLISRKVIGTGIESALLDAVAKESDRILVRHRRTDRNAPARSFLHGLARREVGGEPVEFSRDQLPGAPRWIRVRDRHAEASANTP